MNEPLDLDRLLADAADAYRPHPNRARLDAMLTRRSHLRRAMVVVGAAAAVLLMGSAAWALRADDRPRLGPARPEEVTEATRTTVEKDHPPFSTVAKPIGTVPGTDPTPTQPPATEPTPTAPKPTAPKPTAPKPTEPKPTEPKPTDPPTTEPKYVLLANQTYGSCAENPPYDVFYGTTKPGALVVIESQYSNRIEVQANEVGGFEIRVDFFVEAPVGVPFKVYVISGPYTTKFWFTHTASV